MSFRTSLATTILGIVAVASVWHAGVLASRPETHPLVRNGDHGMTDSAAFRSGRSSLKSIVDLPLAFEANSGQTAAPVKFIARAGRSNLLLTPQSIEVASDESFAIKFAGATFGCEPQGVDPLLGRRNYILGNDNSKWHTDVPTFSRVTYRDLYPGIDLTFYGKQNEFEYDLVVNPGAEASAIRFRIQGARPQITAAGDLILKRGPAELIQRRPIIYQQRDGRRRFIDGHYSLSRNREVTISIGEYDQSQPLVIDPVLSYSTYLGGSGDDSGSSIARDSSGNLYIAGTTASTNFPTHAAAFPSNKGLSDIFVTKIDPTGSTVIYSTYIGGSGVDRGDGIAVDTNGNAYVVGRVDPASADFPTTAGSFGPTYHGGDFDGIVFKLNAQGNGLVYSGFLGGEENDSTEGVAVDPAGQAYVTGGTKSNAFPVTLNAYQGQRAGDTDAYLTKINSAGTGLLYSSFIGGSGTDRGSGVVVDGNGIAYVAGYGASPDFPTQDPFQAGFGGSFDAFIAKFDTNASGINSLVFSTYLGGSGDDRAFGIAADAGVNNIYVVGQTSSNNFPVLNPLQASSGGSFDAFIAKVSSSGTKIFATYFGGSADDRATGVAVNATGVYVTGFTSSTNLPTVLPLQLNNAGGYDAFVAKLNQGGSALFYSTYLGGSANESFVTAVTSTNPIAVDSSNAYITGSTASTNLPVVSPLQNASGGGQDAFIAKIADSTPGANPIDAADFFVHQHYLDFLNREPDPSGYQFWINQITSCGADPQCTQVKRINVSAAFFLSLEFNQTGLLAYLTNKTAFGNMSPPNAPVPLTFNQFTHDAQELGQNYVFGAPGAEAQLEANKQAYFDEFVTRPQFVSKYGSLSNRAYVDTLFNTAGIAQTSTELYIAQLNGAQVVPASSSTATGLVILRQSLSGFSVAVTLSFNGLGSAETAAHLHGPAVATANAPAIATLPQGQFVNFPITLTNSQENDLAGGFQYVDIHTTGFPNGEIRAQLPKNQFVHDVILNALDNGWITRAQALRLVAESEALKANEFNRAFVALEYFGYLRRDPDLAGYNFWLNKLTQFNGDYIAAEMVKAFISSSEYRQRFGS